MTAVPESDEDMLFDGVRVKVDWDLVRLALDEFQDQIDEALESGESRDGYSFCGCSTCTDRVMTGFWISRTIEWQREGLIG